MSARDSSAFRAGGGAMGARLREFDWATTALGPVSEWPASLRIAAESALATDFPTCVFWGDDLVAIYNDGYRLILGQKHEALGQPMRLTWAEVWPELEPIARKALQGESTFIEDFLIRIDRKGYLEDAYFTFCYSPVYDAQGEIVGIVDTVVETTSKVQGERKAAAERERQQRALQQMPGFVAVLAGPAHVYTYVNDAYVQLSGPRGFVGRTVKEVFPELEGQGFFELLDNVYATGTPLHAAALPIELADNPSTRYIDLLYAPIRDAQEQITGIFVGGYDVTAHVQAKAQLEASEARLRELTASLAQQVEERTLALRDSEDFTRLALGATGGVGVWTYLAASDKFYCDAAIIDLYGLDDSEATNGVARTEFLRNVHPEDLPRLNKVMADSLAAGGPVEMEYRVRHPDGSVRWVLSRGHTYLDDRGRPMRRTGVGIDMTRQRQLEEQLRQSQKMDAVGQLTGGIAHDFNNMLQGIVMPLQLIRKRLEMGRIDGLDRYVQAGLDSAQRAASITQRLLAFSRRQPLANRVVDMGAAVMGLEEILRNAAGENVVLNFQLQPGLWHVLTDAHQLESAVLNLAINARDAMPDGGAITFTARNVVIDAREAARIDGLQPGEYAKVSVCDTGVGMPPEVLAQAFEPFFTTKPLGQGTGLGLSMIYGYARQSKGSVAIESREGEGTCVYLYLPRVLGGLPEVQVTSPMPLPSTGPHRILVVEDDEVVRRMAVELLRDHGYEVLEAGDGNSAIALLEGAIDIDLLITDVGLPGPNGRQVADFAMERRDGIKVILITGYAAHVATDVALLQGGVELMAKPFDADVLLHKVGTMLRR